MQTIAIISYLIIIFIFFYLTNRSNIIEIWRGRKEFRCKRDGCCCRLLVQVSKADIRRLEKVGHKKEDFIQKKKGKNYIKQINGYCPWLKISKGVAECTVYNYRPDICRVFPLKKILGMKAHDIRCIAFKKR